MWLIDTTSLELKFFHTADEVPYAILSHTWEEEEITFQEMKLKSDVDAKKGFQKIVACCRRAREDEYQYAWVDTCCIDKSSSTELSEAINSMFGWYRKAAICYAYLADVEWFDDNLDPDVCWNNLYWCRWFQRGWTLQELLAPLRVQFFSRDWRLLGSKLQMCKTISDITGIRPSALYGKPLSEFNVAERFSWAAKRQTTREEDVAYSLLGVFGIYMPLIYGEGASAFRRLQERIIEEVEDYTIFCWQVPPVLDYTHDGGWRYDARSRSPSVLSLSSADDDDTEPSRPSLGVHGRDKLETNDALAGTTAMLAKNPRCFDVDFLLERFKYAKSKPAWNYSQLSRTPFFRTSGLEAEPMAITPRGIKMNIPILRQRSGSAYAVLSTLDDKTDDFLLCLEVVMPRNRLQSMWRRGNELIVKRTLTWPKRNAVHQVFGARRDLEPPVDTNIIFLHRVAEELCEELPIELHLIAARLADENDWCHDCKTYTLMIITPGGAKHCVPCSRAPGHVLQRRYRRWQAESMETLMRDEPAIFDEAMISALDTTAFAIDDTEFMTKYRRALAKVEDNVTFDGSGTYQKVFSVESALCIHYPSVEMRILRVLTCCLFAVGKSACGLGSNPTDLFGCLERAFTYKSITGITALRICLTFPNTARVLDLRDLLRGISPFAKGKRDKTVMRLAWATLTQRCRNRTLGATEALEVYDLEAAAHETTRDALFEFFRCLPELPSRGAVDAYIHWLHEVLLIWSEIATPADLHMVFHGIIILDQDAGASSSHRTRPQGRCGGLLKLLRYYCFKKCTALQIHLEGYGAIEDDARNLRYDEPLWAMTWPITVQVTWGELVEAVLKDVQKLDWGASKV